jgi:hypothetical protein
MCSERSARTASVPASFSSRFIRDCACAGLAGLGLEAVDELLQVLALDLFLLEGDLLQAQVLGALRSKPCTHRCRAWRALVQVQRVGAHAVQELAVVRDHQQRAGVLEQPLLKPQHRVQVEVVGGLIEQQQVRRRHQRPGDVEAHAPAAGELPTGRRASRAGSPGRAAACRHAPAAS